MKKIFLYLSCFCLTILVGLSSPALANSGVKASIALSPAGSFEAQSPRVRGNVKKNSDGSLSASQLRVSVDSLVTGIELRDQHLHEKLQQKAHPNIIVSQAKGQGGKGSAVLELGGVKKQIPFTYKEMGKKVEVNFTINLKDFSIAGISYMGVGVQDQVKVQAYVSVR